MEGEEKKENETRFGYAQRKLRIKYERGTRLYEGGAMCEVGELGPMVNLPASTISRPSLP